mmetsp:Transcript_60983/g.175680  ORF Transcript_60983/g.175680 Transcript_60983/m.175680 type:complete len:89 (-) Transcript_60983:119-385(-)
MAPLCGQLVVKNTFIHFVFDDGRRLMRTSSAPCLPSGGSSLGSTSTATDELPLSADGRAPSGRTTRRQRPSKKKRERMAKALAPSGRS